MAMTIPTIPSLPAGYIVQPGDLNNIAAGCTFLLGKPLSRVHQASSGQSIAVSPGTKVNWDTVDFDPDGMYSVGSPSQLTIQTPGFYKIRYMVQMTASTNIGNAYVLVTTGSGNPAGAGITQQCWGSYAWGITSYAMCASGILPGYLYASDFVQITAVPNTAATTFISDVASFISLELVSI